jgi:hypothetical protein
MSGRALIRFLAVWLVLAAVVVRAGVLTRVPPLALTLALVAVQLALVFAIPAVGRWAREVDLRVLVLPHVLRLVGFVLPQKVGQGALPPEFIPIGWGDIVAAAGAIALLAAGPDLLTGRRGLFLWGWNLFGSADMLLLLLKAAPIALRSPEKLTLFTSLPFGLLPLFVVPMIIASHVLIFRRIYSKGA